MSNDTVQMNVAAGKLPPGWCYDDLQDLLDKFSALMQVTFPLNINFVNYGPNIPPIDEQGRPWFRTNLDGSPDKMYVFFEGVWCSLHPTPASSNEVRYFKGALNDIWSYDGGDGANPSTTAPTAISGAMWQLDGSSQGRFIIGADGGGYQVNALGGESQVYLGINNLPSHSHNYNNANDIPGEEARGNGRGGEHYPPNPTLSIGKEMRAGTGWTGAQGGNEPHNNLPPFIAYWPIRRTARKYYVIKP